VRNRVAGSRTRSLVKAMVAIAGLLLVVTAHAAVAAQGGGNTVESSMPTNIAGPLGIIVAAVGLSGLVLGLWRFLRKSAKAKLTATQPEKPRTPARTS
jgi:hypothetical protein